MNKIRISESAAADKQRQSRERGRVLLGKIPSLEVTTRVRRWSCNMVNVVRHLNEAIAPCRVLRIQRGFPEETPESISGPLEQFCCLTDVA